MRFGLLILAILSVFPHSAFAQNENLDITSEPICFRVRNEADYKVFVKFTTAYYVRPDGIKTRHRSQTYLEPKGTMETGEDGNTYPVDVGEFCSYGPFLPNRSLDFQITNGMIPLFGCRTRIDQGEIVIKGHRKKKGGTETYAECYL